MIKKKILIPLDRSEYGGKILPQIEKFVQPVDTEIVLFHTIHEQPGIGLSHIYVPHGAHEHAMPSKGRTPYPILPPQEKDDVRHEIEKELLSVAKQLQKAGFKISVEVYFGDPKKEILNAIEDLGIDMVAMTTHARAGLGKFVFGSVADHILHHVSIPILMMHPS